MVPYEVKFSVCGLIYIGNKYQISKKIMDDHFYDFKPLLKNGQK